MSVIKTGKYSSHQEYLLQAMQDKPSNYFVYGKVLSSCLEQQ